MLTMCPDINSLPPSRSTSASPRQRRTLPSLLDLASAGPPNSTPSSFNNHLSGNSTMTSELPRRHHPISGSDRRRSGNLSLSSGGNNYSEPSIGDMPPPSDHRSSIGHGLRNSSPSNIGGSPVVSTGDPHHQRTPSLGELHQELEQEQEAQVNRLLQTIRSQQARLQHLEQQHQQPQSAVDDVTPSSGRSTPFPLVAPLPTAGHRTSIQLPSSLSSSRQSQAQSPHLRPLADSRGPETLEWAPSPSESAGRRGSRDESSFYQAEATMLARENQMLRQRVRELVNELSTNASTLGMSVTTPDAPNPGAESDGESSDKT
ncbi:uncharacterized protein BJX67DRAFT_17722 [Aspergillus lucknowensis]|uniref:Uncharacterized protein n=1 Tax=Aspergillus lucknowensis TaxID=176173 RepID=A0ABR4M832_9EURO